LFALFRVRTYSCITRSSAAIVCLVFFALLLFGCAGYKPPAATPEPAITLSASSFDFKTVVIGQEVSQTLHITNSGGAPLRITGLSLSNKQFVLTGPSIPRVVLPNLSLDYTLAFLPTAAGTATASLSVLSNAQNTLPAVSLSGVGEKVIAALQISPVALNFGSQKLRSTSSKNVSLKNTGDVNLTINGITVIGAGFGYSDLSPGYSLPPNQQVTFQVWFKPLVKGSASGKISILSTNLASAADLSVAGDGVSSASQHNVHLSWDPSTSSVIGYHVYRAPAATGPFGMLSSGTVTATDYDDSTVSSGTTYYYEVTAFDASGEESPGSNVATAVIPNP
jgi:hypothetical protein